LVGTIGGNEQVVTTYTLSLKGQKPGNTYCNSGSARLGIDGSIMDTGKKTSTVIGREISGKAWLDANENRAYDDGIDTPVSGVKAELYRADDTPVVKDAYGATYNVITGSKGEYKFENVPSYENGYYVKFVDNGAFKLEDYLPIKGDAALISERNGVGKLTSLQTTALNLRTDTEQISDGILLERKAADVGFERAVTLKYVSEDTKKGTVKPAAEIIYADDNAQGSSATPKGNCKFVRWIDAAKNQVGTDLNFIPAQTNGRHVSATYTAQWKETPLPPKPPKPPIPPTLITSVTPEHHKDSPKPHSGDLSMEKAGKPDVQKNEPKTGNPPTDLFSDNAAQDDGNMEWSLISLFMSALAVIITLLLAIGALFHWKKGEGSASYDASRDAYNDEAEEKNRKRGNLLKSLTCVAGVLTLIVWLLLDDLSLPVAWINKWTFVVAIIFVMHLVLLILYRICKSRAHSHKENGPEQNEIA
jgi:preprotein translocase subunit SecG